MHRDYNYSLACKNLYQNKIASLPLTLKICTVFLIHSFLIRKVHKKYTQPMFNFGGLKIKEVLIDHIVLVFII